MPIMNYTTQVAASKTCGEVMRALVKAGARGIAIEYDGQKRAVGMTFAILSHGTTYQYRLPVRIGAVQEVLTRQKVPPSLRSLEQAERVAWRIVKDWLHAQLAIIETEMVTVEQIMLPYMRTETGETVFERWETYNQLPAGASA
jgi:hypothetical protein